MRQIFLTIPETKVSIFDFADMYDLEILIEENEAGRYRAVFSPHHVETKVGAILKGVAGYDNGPCSGPDNQSKAKRALLDLIWQIYGQTIVVNAHSDNRRVIEVDVDLFVPNIREKRSSRR